MPPRRRSSSAPAASPSSPTAAPPPATTSTSLLHAVAAWEVEFVVGGVKVTLPAMPASDWVGMLLADEDPIAGLSMLVSDEKMDAIFDQILEGRVAPDALATALQEALTLVSGRDWWLTVRLLHTAQAAWDQVGGYLALHGVRADQMPLQAWMDALLATLLRHVEPKDQAGFLSKLRKAPKGVTAKPIDEEREAALFMASMGG